MLRAVTIRRDRRKQREDEQRADKSEKKADADARNGRDTRAVANDQRADGDDGEKKPQNAKDNRQQNERKEAAAPIACRACGSLENGRADEHCEAEHNRDDDDANTEPIARRLTRWCVRMCLLPLGDILLCGCGIWLSAVEDMTALATSNVANYEFRALWASDHRKRVATPNDPKLSDGGGWRVGCTVGERRRPEAAGVTAGAVRCSAWLGDFERRSEWMSLGM